MKQLRNPAKRPAGWIPSPYDRRNDVIKVVSKAGFARFLRISSVFMRSICVICCETALFCFAALAALREAPVFRAVALQSRKQAPTKSPGPVFCFSGQQP